MATGLVLEGGGMRGIYTSGVLDELLQEGVKVDGLIGVSAGIIHGISYVSEQYARNIRYTVKYRGDKRFLSLTSLIKTGNLCEDEFCYNEIPFKLSPVDFEKFRENVKKGFRVFSVATNLETGSAEYLPVTDVETQMDAIKASASLPLVSRIVEYNGMKLLDGGSADSIPLKAMQERGYDRNIVVLTRPEGFVKKPDRSMPLMKKGYKDYPEYLATCENRYIDYNDELEYVKKEEKKGDTFVIQPSRYIKVSRSETDIEKIKRMYKLGRYDAKNLMVGIKHFMKNENMS